MLTDTSAGIREQYDYDAFGWPYHYNAAGIKLSAGAQWGNRFLFTGREWLKDLKVYDYRNRMYQPELGRFLQPDPLHFGAGDYNLYRYCHNDPVNHVDPNGTLVWFIAIPLWMAADWAYDKYAAEHVNNFVSRNFGQETAGNLRTVGNAIDTARALKNPAKLAGNIRSTLPTKKPGSNTNTHASGKRYHGKGDQARSQTSADRVADEHGDTPTATDWTAAKTDREAFKQEHQRLQSDGGPKNPDNYSKINSPGKKLTELDDELDP